MGKYIAFLDADDLYPGPYARNAFGAAEKAVPWSGGGSIEKAKGTMCTPCLFSRRRAFITPMMSRSDCFFARFIYNRNFLLENKLQFAAAGCVYEDPIFLLCTLLKAKEYYAVPDVVYRYNGTHSNKRITLACTKDYLRGLIAELKLSKKKDLPEIHTLCCDRLMREADFYAQRFLKTEDPELLAL